MYAWLKHNGVPVCLVATKADKIPKGKWQKHMKIVRETLGVDKSDPLVLFSSETGLGKDELWSVIEQRIGDGAISEPEDAINNAKENESR